jgi:hypothetical protein
MGLGAVLRVAAPAGRLLTGGALLARRELALHDRRVRRCHAVAPGFRRLWTLTAPFYENGAVATARALLGQS